MARPGPDPVDVGRAWELHLEGRSLRYIGEQLQCSPATAANWVKQAQLVSEYGAVHDALTDRQAMHELLRQLAAWGCDRLKMGGIYEEVVPVLLKVTDQINRMSGHYAPIRMTVGAEDGPAVSPELVDEVRAAEMRVRQDTQALLAGEGD